MSARTVWDVNSGSRYCRHHRKVCLQVLEARTRILTGAFTQKAAKWSRIQDRYRSQFVFGTTKSKVGLAGQKATE